MNNFKDIIEYKKSSGKEVVLLIGNHDYHYMHYSGVRESYSGYQDGKAALIAMVLEENKEHLQMAHYQDGILFTHAGVTKTWLGSHPEIDEYPTLEAGINALFKHKPLEFGFSGWDPYGDNVTQGPLWVRPRSLMIDKVTGFIQVVGHTGVKEIKDIGDIYCIDALPEQFLQIVDGQINVITNDVF